MRIPHALHHPPHLTARIPSLVSLFSPYNPFYLPTNPNILDSTPAPYTHCSLLNFLFTLYKNLICFYIQLMMSLFVAYEQITKQRSLPVA